MNSVQILDSSSAESDQDDDSSEENSQPQKQAVQPTKLMESKPLESQQPEDEDKTEAKSSQVCNFAIQFYLSFDKL